MREDKRKNGLSVLFDAFDYPLSFYVLGAGASAGIAPLTAQFKANIVNRFLSFGSF